MYNDLMIDLETLGQTPQCPVISIGACLFDIPTKQKGPTFYLALDTSEQLQKGRIPDGSTLKWWMQQTDAAKKVFNEKSVKTLEALTIFNKWIFANIQDSRKYYVWGNGSTFDISILEDLYKMYGISVPWLYYNIMDLRTFKRFVGKNEKLVKSGVNHNALDDAISQVDYVLKYF